MPDSQSNGRPLRIAMFTEAYPPIISGVVMATQTLVAGLREMGHVVHVYAPRHPDQPRHEPDVTRLPSVHVPLPGYIPISVPLTPLQFQNIVRDHYDIAHTQHPFLLGTVARALSREDDIPLVCTVHTQYEQYVHYWTPWHEPGRWIVRKLIRDFCNDCDQVTTVADGMAALLREYGVSTPVTVIPNDVDLGDFLDADGAGLREELGVEPHECLLLSVSRIAPEKNLGFILESLAPLLRSGGARMVFVGDGPGRADLERRAAEEGLSERVVFTGAIPHAQTPRYYAAADLFLMASVTEVNPLTIGESLAAGTPVVAVDSFSAREAIVDGQDGLVAPSDPAAFRRAVEGLLESPEDRSRMAASAQQTARSRTAGSAAERTLALYREVLAARRREPASALQD